VSFDDPNLVANARLLLTATLSDRLGLEAMIDDTVKLAGRVGGTCGGTDRRPVTANKSATNSSGNNRRPSRCNTDQIESTPTRSLTNPAVPFNKSD